MSNSKYSVPEEIRAFKPKGTMVKNIRGRFYVYEMKNINSNGSWKIKCGKMIGKITFENGFIPNDNFSQNGEMTVLDYGAYAIALKASQNVFVRLNKIFGENASSIYSTAIIFAVNNYVPINQINEFYKQSVLSIALPNAKSSENTISNLYAYIGRHESKVISYYEEISKECEGKDIAIDGHVITTNSSNNDLSEAGYKTTILKSNMMSLLTIYCIEEKRPLASMMIRGGSVDKKSVLQLLSAYKIENRLTIIDNDFFNEDFFKMLNDNGCKFLIRASQNLSIYKDITKPTRGAKKSFLYHLGKGKNAKNVTIEYKEIVEEKKKRRAIWYKDLSSAASLDSDYLYNLQNGTKGFTKEGYQELKKTAGIIVLYTDSDRTAEELYDTYKSRWTIETYYDMVDNKIDINNLKIENYYELQGLSLVINVAMEITSLLMQKTIKTNKPRTEILLEARRIKISKINNKWQLRNILSSQTKPIFDIFDLSIIEPMNWFAFGVSIPNN